MTDTQKPVNPEDLEQRLQALEERERALEEKETELKQRESKFTGAKYNLYSHINVSLKTMNIVVAVIAIALVLAIVAGVIYR
ncbi:hypothetical protein [Anaerotignum lactatifermentans]|uniref:hypothetical protein n=1 Tax=Anaerotignum lactatifermentans TaxID=160404 RepID=UPI00307BEA13